MNNPEEIIIIGGGSSIKEGLSLGLKDKIKDKFIFTCNYAYKHFEGTALTFIDKLFYKTNDIKVNPDIYEELKKLPLIIGVNDDGNGLDEAKHPNTLLVNKSFNYHREKSLEKGFFLGSLTGIFSLSLASWLLNYAGTIFLLGFDWTTTENTHYYDEIKHRGVGYSNFYKNHAAKHYFDYFKETNLKIYNVSLQSNIDSFEKISYEKMFELLNKSTYNQEELRSYIKSRLTILK